MRTAGLQNAVPDVGAATQLAFDGESFTLKRVGSGLLDVARTSTLSANLVTGVPKRIEL